MQAEAGSDPSFGDEEETADLDEDPEVVEDTLNPSIEDEKDTPKPAQEDRPTRSLFDRLSPRSYSTTRDIAVEAMKNEVVEEVREVGKVARNNGVGIAEILLKQAEESKTRTEIIARLEKLRVEGQ